MSFARMEQDSCQGFLCTALHYAIKNAHSCPSSFADTSPDVYFCWMFRPIKRKMHKQVNVSNCCMQQRRHWNTLATVIDTILYRYYMCICVYILRLWSWGLSLLTTTEATVVFHLYRGFIGEDHVIKEVSKVLTCPCQSFLLVDVSDHLTVSTATKSPS